LKTTCYSKGVEEPYLQNNFEGFSVFVTATVIGIFDISTFPINKLDYFFERLYLVFNIIQKEMFDSILYCKLEHNHSKTEDSTRAPIGEDQLPRSLIPVQKVLQSLLQHPTKTCSER